MNKSGMQAHSSDLMTVLLQLTLGTSKEQRRFSSGMSDPTVEVRSMSSERFSCMVELAKSNHVIVRGLQAFLDQAETQENGPCEGWARTALKTEKERITNAVEHLKEVCRVFEEQQYDFAVIKSLDHWPDLGSDLDMYTNADVEDVLELMRKHFQATTGPRSWGDRLAQKYNFYIPGLPEAVEIHVGRLGQTGEQAEIAARLTERTRKVELDGRLFRLTSSSDRLMISTLQRMYRHFYFRLCDIVDSNELLDSGLVDFNDLRTSAMLAGIWEGVATYLLIVSDYVEEYTGTVPDLPQFVIDAARFGGDEIYFAREFLRVPIMPQSAKLYASQLAGLLQKRELKNSARLSLLPCLATAAFVGQQITGSDKGIW